MSKAKMIEVGDGYTVQFLQRAPGEETPYFHATILKDSKEVGWAKNNGRGGATHIRGEKIEQDFATLVTAAIVEAGFHPEKTLQYERASVILGFAECKGYSRGCGQMTLAEYVKIVAEYVKIVAD